jgi:hypothetical protein
MEEEARESHEKNKPRLTSTFRCYLSHTFGVHEYGHHALFGGVFWKTCDPRRDVPNSTKMMSRRLVYSFFLWEGRGKLEAQQMTPRVSNDRAVVQRQSYSGR